MKQTQLVLIYDFQANLILVHFAPEFPQNYLIFKPGLPH